MCVLLVGHMRTFRLTAPTLRRRIRHRGVRFFVSTYTTHELTSFNQRRRRGNHFATSLSRVNLTEHDVKEIYGKNTQVRFSPFGGYAGPPDYNYSAQLRHLREAVAHWQARRLLDACDVAIVSRPDIRMERDLHFPLSAVARVGPLQDAHRTRANDTETTTYSLRQGIIFTTHRLSRCDPKVSDFFMVMQGRALKLLATQPDARCDYDPVDGPPMPERALMRLLLIQHAHTAATVESLAVVQRDEKTIEKCKCACGEVATSKRILSYNGYACGPPSGEARVCRLEMPHDAQWTAAFGTRAATAISRCEIIDLRLPTHAGVRWSEPLAHFWASNNTAVRASSDDQHRAWDWEVAALRVHPSLARLAAPPDEALSWDLRTRLDQMYPSCRASAAEFADQFVPNALRPGRSGEPAKRCVRARTASDASARGAMPSRT